MPINNFQQMYVDTRPSDGSVDPADYIPIENLNSLMTMIIAVESDSQFRTFAHAAGFPILDNPALLFNQNSANGKYDYLSDDEYQNLKNTVAQISSNWWCKSDRFVIKLNDLYDDLTDSLEKAMKPLSTIIKYMTLYEKIGKKLITEQYNDEQD